ncbi:non-intrinsic ABC protein 12, partial [Perilla frutescens var. frutescens]
GVLSLVLIVFYNCSDQVLTTRYERIAKSRERAIKSTRETAQARERWKIAREAAKKGAAGLQKQLSRTFSRNKGDAPVPSNSSIPPSGVHNAKKEAGSLTKMVQSLETDLDSHSGFDMAIGDRHIKKQMPKAKQLHTKSQIFKYAYGQLEKEKAMEQMQQNLTFSG